jgi:predicted amidohydrolase YtcJ
MEDNLFETEPENINKIKVFKTYFEGKEVYSRL